MMRKRNYTAAFLLSMLCAWAVCGTLTSAFDIPLEPDWKYAAVWVLGCFVCMAALSVRRGGWLLLGINVVLAVAVWRWRVLRMPVLQLVRCIALIFDSAYGWGIPGFLPESSAVCDPAVMLLGLAVTECVCAAVLRRHGGWLGSAALIVPLAVCLLVTDTVPDTIYLFGLLLGLVLLLLTDSVRTESTAQGVHLLAISLLPAALALGLLFYVYPRENYQNPAPHLREQAAVYLRQLPERFLNGDLPLQGFERVQQQVTLESLPPQPQLGLPVAEVASDRSGTLYLRLKDYDVYTGAAWISSASRLENISGTGTPLGTVVVRELSNQGSMLLPAFPEGDMLLSDGSAFSEEKVYRLNCVSEAMAARPGENWLVLPEKTALRVGELLKRVSGHVPQSRDAAQAIAEYVRSSAVYDRNPDTMPADEDEFAAWFLESGERGYCVHFATAAAVMLRSAGIPARYVTGYRVETVGAETVQVTSNDAHAWTEYYDYETWSWVILDPTPPDFAPETAPEPPQTTAQTEPASVQETQTVPTAPEQAIPEPQKPEATWQFPVKVFLRTLLIGLLLSMAEVQRQLRIRLRRRFQQKGSSNASAMKQWREIQLLHRLMKDTAEDELTELAEKAVFSQHTLTAAELHRFAADASRCRKHLRRAKWWKRLTYRYWYAVI